MPKRKKLKSGDLIDAALALLEMLSSSPGHRVAQADARRALGLDQQQLETVIETIGSLANQGTGSRAAIGRDADDITLQGDAAQILPLRLSTQENMVLGYVLGSLGIDDEVRERVGRALLPVAERGTSHGTLGGTALYGAFYQRLVEAIDDGVRCRITYRSLSDAAPKTRTVDPLAMDSTEAAAYLIAWDVTADAQRRYRLDRIADVAYTDDSVTTHDWTRARVQETLRESPVAVLRFPSEQYARYLGWDGLGRIKPVDRGASEEVYGEVRVSSETWLFDQVLATGGDVKIVAPAALRERLAAYGRALLDEVR